MWWFWLCSTGCIIKRKAQARRRRKSFGATTKVMQSLVYVFSLMFFLLFVNNSRVFFIFGHVTGWDVFWPIGEIEKTWINGQTTRHGRTDHGHGIGRQDKNGRSNRMMRSLLSFCRFDNTLLFLSFLISFPFSFFVFSSLINKIHFRPRIINRQWAAVRMGTESLRQTSDLADQRTQKGLLMGSRQTSANDRQQ